MRWFVAGVIAAALAWAAYAASPYWALGRLAAAVEAGNVEEVGARVNFRALRHNLSRHLVSDLTAADRTGALGSPDAQLAAAAIAAAANPLVEQMLTPTGVVALLRGAARGGPESESTSPSLGAPSFDRIASLLEASSWRGFRNVYFTLPPEASRDARFRIQLRISRLSWRLVGIELPSDMRRRIALQGIGRARPR